MTNRVHVATHHVEFFRRHGLVVDTQTRTGKIETQHAVVFPEALGKPIPGAQTLVGRMHQQHSRARPLIDVMELDAVEIGVARIGQLVFGAQRLDGNGGNRVRLGGADNHRYTRAQRECQRPNETNGAAHNQLRFCVQCLKNLTLCRTAYRWPNPLYTTPPGPFAGEAPRPARGRRALQTAGPLRPPGRGFCDAHLPNGPARRGLR